MGLTDGLNGREEKKSVLDIIETTETMLRLFKIMLSIL